MATKWKVVGVLRDSGLDFEREVEAPSREDAVRIAGQDMLVESVEIVAPKSPFAHPVPKPIPVVTPYKHTLLVSRIFVALAIVSFLLAMLFAVLCVALVGGDIATYKAGTVACLAYGLSMWAVAAVIGILREIAINTRKV